MSKAWTCTTLDLTFVAAAMTRTDATIPVTPSKMTVTMCSSSVPKCGATLSMVQLETSQMMK